MENITLRLGRTTASSASHGADCCCG